jgi:hypothetical protein
MEIREVCDAMVVLSAARSEHNSHISELNPFQMISAIANTIHLSGVYDLF